MGSPGEPILGSHAVPFIRILYIYPPGEPKMSSPGEPILGSRFATPGSLLPPPPGRFWCLSRVAFGPPPGSLFGASLGPSFFERQLVSDPNASMPSPPSSPEPVSPLPRLGFGNEPGIQWAESLRVHGPPSPPAIEKGLSGRSQAKPHILVFHESCHVPFLDVRDSRRKSRWVC